MIKLENSNNAQLILTAPKVNSPKQMHFVVVITDNGEPKLTRYQRVIVTVET
jgi:hypothetical protein